MVLKIAFTDLEMIAFLTKRGYQVVEKEVIAHEFLHGSKFKEWKKTEWTATKEDFSGRLSTAFEHELKTKLLNE
ncbi:hypothetical protein ACTFAO_07545 [Sphingobacterium spiritivorum]|uniref:hypothetical protein n=1 Tax=Sphingobacterium spiritivorum TaxID=258 RepID=UPI003F76F73F